MSRKVKASSCKTTRLRYYDLNILRILLTRGTATQHIPLFGPVSTYWLQGQRYSRPESTATGGAGIYPISQAQLDGLEVWQWEGLISQQVEKLRQITARNPAELEALFRQGIARALGYGLESRNEVSTFAALWVAGLDDEMLANNAALDEQLSHPGYAGWEKVQRARRLLIQQGTAA